jgi:hypothetical protein
VERLHALRLQAHDGEPVEAEIAGKGLLDPRKIGAAGFGAVEAGFELLRLQKKTGEAHDRTHIKKHLQIYLGSQLSYYFRTNCCQIRGAT